MYTYTAWRRAATGVGQDLAAPGAYGMIGGVNSAPHRQAGAAKGGGQMGFFDRLKAAVSKTRDALVDKVQSVVSGYTRLDDELYEELEEALIQADVGVGTATELVEALRRTAKERKLTEPAGLTPLLAELIRARLGEPARLTLAPAGLSVVLVVGVNGVGKTTTIGKLAHYLKGQGHRVLLAAGDTFRAAAGEQLGIWGQRAGCDVIRHGEGADPAAVAFDAIAAARSRSADLVLVDTAGRLHTKANLMEELKKVGRVIAREVPGAPHEVLLVLDATTGQNAVQQAKLFKAAAGVTGIALTKLDGTAKGGVVLAIRQGEGIPVKFIGVGEGIDDLQPFDPVEFATALFGVGAQ